MIHASRFTPLCTSDLVSKWMVLASNLSSIYIPQELDLTITNTTQIRLDSGSLTANPFFTSRETRIDVNAGSVHGEYGLYDLLSVHTKAGSVKIDVIPKPADKETPLPAEFIAGSQTGSVHVAFPPPGTEIPEREYHTTASSHYGSVSGNFIHGVKTILTTNAGSITAQLLPYAANAYSSILETRTDTGGQRIELLSPYVDAKCLIKRLSSTHYTHASSLKLKYPSEWEGSIHGHTGAGSLTLRGKDVKIIEEGGGPVGHYVSAEKGNGNSTMDFRTDFGSAHVDME